MRKIDIQSIPPSVSRPSRPLLDRLRVAEQDVLDVAHAGPDAGGVVAAPELRNDGVLDDDLAHQSR